MRKYLDAVLDNFGPKYNELTAFLTALACFLFALIHYGTLSYFVSLFQESNSGIFLFIFAIAFAGFVMSIYHVFVKKVKNVIEATSISVFITLINGVAGIASGSEMLNKQTSDFAFSAIWNIATGLFLLYQIGLLNFSMKDDENASLVEVLIGSLLLITAFVLLEVNFHLSWATALSMSLFYSSMIALLISIGSYFYRSIIFSNG